MQQGGRFGRHSEHLGHLLSELQSMQRTFRGSHGDASRDAELRRRAWDAAATVVDPEIPVLTIADLGVLREVAVTDGRVEVAITPTYSGCPAMNMIALEIELALERDGFRESRVRTVLSPAWTTDWMSEEGRRKLREYGIAPPQPAARAARCSACSRWHARNADRRIPKCCPNSARPPARRYGAARAAANRSIISSVTESSFNRHCGESEAIHHARKKGIIGRVRRPAPRNDGEWVLTMSHPRFHRLAVTIRAAKPPMRCR